MYGLYSSSYDYKIDNVKAFTEHLIAQTSVENIETNKNSIIIDNKKIFSFERKNIEDIDPREPDISPSDIKKHLIHLKTH